ncbi:MAG: PTS transporter subunit EIIA [Fibrobacter sp.]|jgi:Kef-type K+ transport system membrane component KefB/mannitol/fructose-specific phosphotransferase system IIA component (Ntr-type)|nr:PTS transporter subunit EIIA [Fibrobacter sp.]
MEKMPEALAENYILLFLLQFFLLLVFSRLMDLLFTKIRQPTVTGDVLVGVILGPSILGRFWPSVYQKIFPSDPLQVAMLDTVAWIGIFFLLLVTGLEVNFSRVWKHRGKAAWIAISDIVIPILFSAIILFFLPSRYLINPEQRFLFVFFISTIMTISAMPVSIRVMHDLKLLRTDLGFLTISALSINDIAGWIVFTIILGMFAHGSPDLSFVLWLVISTAIFLFLATTAGKKLIGKILSLIQRKSIEASGPALSVVLSAGLLFGTITQQIGIHGLFGFFVAGLVAGEAVDLPEKTRFTIDQFVSSVFIPIFFANIGLKIDLFKSFDFFLVILFVVMGITARFLGAYIGVKIARIPKAQHWPISALHTPGGEMHIVVGTIALDLQLINEMVFVAIIVSAIVSTLTLGPALSLMIKRIVPSKTVQIPPEAVLEITDKSKLEAIKSLSESAAKIVGISADAIYQRAKNREEGMSTGMEKCIAIPHARITDLKKSAVIFGRSKKGIEWNTPDGLPAKLIFLIVTPFDQADTQLQIYRQLVSVLLKKEYRETIIATSSIRRATETLNEGLRLTAIAG